MTLPGFSAECSLSEASERYITSPRPTRTESQAQNVVTAALARELSPREMRACYFACRSGAGALGHAFCAASCF